MKFLKSCVEFVSSRSPVIDLLENRRMFTGTWSTITSAIPGGGAQTGVVLTNGSIMVHQGSGSASSAWSKLTPSASGSYTAGTWSTLASSNYTRLYTATQVLTSGKVLTIGGEYSNAGSITNTGEIYNPVTNAWTNISPFPNSSFGDDPSALLPDGRVLAGYIFSGATYIYDPNANTWTQTGTKLRNDRSDEESWVTLPDHSILSYDVFGSTSSAVHAQRYIPSTGTWVDAGNPPALLSTSAVGYELGPGLLLPDGRVLFTGGNNNTAYYNQSSNSWTAGPSMPNGYVMADAPGAVLPNGNVLLAMAPQGTLNSKNAYQWPNGTKIYELNTATNVYTDVTPSLSGFSMNNPSFIFTFLVLPTGQVAAFNDSGTIAIYTESGSPLAAAVPIITGISYAGSTGTYTLSGSNLNGINDGAAYGDDNEMSSNYPLVRLIDSSGNVTYATTTNWSQTGVAQAAETVTFTLPAGDTSGAYLVQSVANGVPSATALAVLVNANTTSTVTIQTDANPGLVDVVGSGTIEATFADSQFSSIYLAGDNSGDTLSVNLNSSAGNIITNIQAGPGADTIDVNQTSATGPVVIDPSNGNDAVNVGTVGAGTAIARFLASQQIGLLSIGSGGTATVLGGSTKTLLQTNGVATSGSGVLDLTSNDMIVHGGDLNALTAELFSGLNLTGGGYWNGPGIISSTAASDGAHIRALGMILNESNGSPLYGSGLPLGTFDGQSPAITDVLIKYTYFGDTNLDGQVDGSDYANADNGFLSQTTGWFNGDFNYDNAVDGSDYTLLDNAFNSQGARIAAIISPSPAASVTAAASLPYVSQTTDDDLLKQKKSVANVAQSIF